MLPVADIETKSRILALLEVRVQVLRSEPCPTMASATSRDPAAKTAVQPGRNRGNADKTCPACRRHRHLPVLEIEGMVPEANLDDTPAESVRWPFVVEGGI